MSLRRSALFLACWLSIATASAAQPQVRIQTNVGAFTLALYPARAPKTVANFLRYVKSGFYNGTVFHRVIANFMIQGGGFDQSLRRKATRPPIPNEAANGMKNRAYTIAMARTTDPNSATSQFFINVKDNPFLDYRAPTPAGYGYCVFGKVVTGQAVVNRIAHQPTGAVGPFATNAPLKPIVIEAATIITPKKR